MNQRLGKALVVIAAILAGGSAHAQSNTYSAWSNFPQSSSFFPIAVWSQNPTRSLGSGAPYSTDAAAMAGTKMNILLEIDNGGGGNYPTSFGKDANGLFAALKAEGIYVIPDADYSSNTSVDSVASLQAVALSIGATQYLIGYNLGDEPQGGNGCSTVVPNIPTYLSTVHGYDSTRPFFWNFTDFVFEHGECGGSPDPNIAALKAIDVGSFDLYPLISPWNGSNIPLVAGQPQDSMWIQGWSVEQFRANGRSGQPVWAYMDTGTNALAYSSQNGSSCNVSTNLCAPDNHEYRATAEQVNAETWMSIINGATGIEWFCDDTSQSTGGTAYDFCLGSTASGETATAAGIASNLTYVDTTVLSFAQELNGTTMGLCTMNNGGNYTSYTTTCSNGILTMSTGTSTIPGSAMVKQYNGNLYLFADSDRNGSTTVTFTLSGYAGATATVVYDSNAHYDASHSSIGDAFTLNASGQFSDTLGANGHNYQPKVYEISASGTTSAPSAPTALTAVVQ